jgi:4-amino-4-deoxy-L-arabinose transferase-like glycosyltransferase
MSGMPSVRPRFWRSPPGQPPWARPALLAIAAVAGLAYAWGLSNAVLEDFYGAAARSMSGSWHDFLFGAFDPLGTVTVDKLPGALWVQAIFLRLCGFHTWAVVLPQVLEGVLTVLVLYRAVRRLAGPVAGIAAAGALAISPVTVALNRGNVSDSLLILLTVLAADAASAALLDGRLRSLMLSGVWVGLAFQAKMLQAWLILPALAVAYLVAAPPRLRTRLGGVLAAGALTVVVSLSWMSVVSLVPAHERPYVDGTGNDSLFSQVFDYNGIARLHGGSESSGGVRLPAFLLALSHKGSALQNPARGVPPSWHRLLGGVFGRDDGWLLPAAVFAAAAVPLARRRAGRRDPLRACVLLWGIWLLILAVFFSAGSYLNSYYVAALWPAIAGLCGAGVALLAEQQHHPRARPALAAVLLACVGYGIYLLSGGTDVPGWLIPVASCLGIGGAVAVLACNRPTGPGKLGARVMVFALVCICFLPAVTSALVVHHALGPFAAPYEPASDTVSPAASRQASQLDRQIVAQLSAAFQTPIAFATDSSILAAPYILYTGKEVLPIGGYLGNVPAPSLSGLRRYIATGQVSGFIIPPASHDPRIAWILAHCAPASKETSAAAVVALYRCNQG